MGPCPANRRRWRLEGWDIFPGKSYPILGSYDRGELHEGGATIAGFMLHRIPEPALNCWQLVPRKGYSRDRYSSDPTMAARISSLRTPCFKASTNKLRPPASAARPRNCW